MHVRLIKTLSFLSFASTLLLLLQGCTNPGDSSVSDAYKTSDAIAIQPYNRSIFSSNNF